MTLEIRPARADEAQPVAECVAAAYSKWIPVIGRIPGPMQSDYPGLIARNVVFVAQQQDQIAGVLVLFPQDGAMLIENIAVHPDYQRGGTGRTLMDFAEEEARRAGLSQMALYTNELMVYNQGYYQRLGYTFTRRETWAEGWHIVWMHKPLE